MVVIQCDRIRPRAPGSTGAMELPLSHGVPAGAELKIEPWDWKPAKTPGPDFGGFGTVKRIDRVEVRDLHPADAIALIMLRPALESIGKKPKRVRGEERTRVVPLEVQPPDAVVPSESDRAPVERHLGV